MITTAWFFGEKNLTDVHFIRRAVFIEEQGISEADEMDGTDHMCAHLVAYDENGAPAATGRILVTRDEFIIGRVAVMPTYRKQQYGTLIMQTLIRACNAMGGTKQLIHSQLSAKGFYEKLGFYAVGDVYEEAGIPHVTMVHEGDAEIFCALCAEKTFVKFDEAHN